jgi:hypothetical protein
MSILNPALIAARDDACVWLRRQMRAMHPLHRECGDGRRRPSVTASPVSGQGIVARHSGRRAD